MCIIQMNIGQITSSQQKLGPYGKGYPRNPLSFTRNAQPFYALQADHPQNYHMALPRVACPQGRQPFSTPLDTTRRTGLAKLYQWQRHFRFCSLQKFTARSAIGTFRVRH
jgi:hypothetical protein